MSAQLKVTSDGHVHTNSITVTKTEEGGKPSLNVVHRSDSQKGWLSSLLFSRQTEMDTDTVMPYGGILSRMNGDETTGSRASIVVDGTEFPEGIYLYSLVVNGAEVATEKMVIKK